MLLGIGLTMFGMIIASIFFAWFFTHPDEGFIIFVIVMICCIVIGLLQK